MKKKKTLAGNLASDAQEMRHFPALSHNRHQGHLRKAIVCLQGKIFSDIFAAKIFMRAGHCVHTEASQCVLVPVVDLVSDNLCSVRHRNKKVL